jgi:hypothetical protein
MRTDYIVSVLLIGVFVILTSTQSVMPTVMELLTKLTRPGATILLLGGIAFLYSKGFHASCLILGILSVYLLRQVWTTWPRSDARRLHLEVGRDLARFDPSKSIDLQFGNGTAGFDKPHLRVKPFNPSMLVFPPSHETLKKMNG